jgi:hypothetical protein
MRKPIPLLMGLSLTSRRQLAVWDYWFRYVSPFSVPIWRTNLIEFPRNENIEGLVRTMEDFQAWYEHCLDPEDADHIVLDSFVHR